MRGARPGVRPAAPGQLWISNVQSSEKAMRCFSRVAAVLATISIPVASVAQPAGERATQSAAPASAARSLQHTDGDVRKVDKAAGTILLKHGPIANLDMPAMSMVFRAKDPAMLDQVKPGDKVRFAAEKIGGQYTVTRIERVE